MSSGNFQYNVNLIEPLPRFFTTRFGHQKKIDNDDDDNEQSGHVDHYCEPKLNEVVQPSRVSTNENHSTSILITDIRNRDWSFNDDLKNLQDNTLPDIKYQFVPSMHNTIKNRSVNCNIDKNANHYEEYDLDEQDFQWLMSYNQFRIEKHLPELDENVFEYIIELLEHQCLVAIRQKNYEDSIHCDACHRIDDAYDLVECIQCKTIVHKKCYGIDANETRWLCLACQFDNEPKICCICDQCGGALKMLKNTSDEEEQHWAHLSCAFWHCNIGFDEKMNLILKDKLNYDGRCSVCNKTTGVKINCCWKNCHYRFHPLCAINADQDMFVAERDDKLLVRLLALCCRHTKKIDGSEKLQRRNKFLENQQKRFEQFTSYVNLEKIQKETSIPTDVLDSIHTYWALKRKANHCRPLIDMPEDIFYYDYDKNVNLAEFARLNRLEQQDEPQTKTYEENSKNILQFLTTNSPVSSSSTKNNLFEKFAQWNRTHFISYERNRFCLIDGDKSKHEGLLEYISSLKGSM